MQNFHLNSLRVLSIWRGKQCVTLSNVLLCIIGHLIAALSLIDLARIIYLICL